jgi:hypothetical protein
MNLSDFDRRVKGGLQPEARPGRPQPQSDNETYVPVKPADESQQRGVDWVSRLPPPVKLRPTGENAVAAIAVATEAPPAPSEPKPKRRAKLVRADGKSGNGTLVLLFVSIVAMSAYLAMGGPRLIWPDAGKPGVARDVASSSVDSDLPQQTYTYGRSRAPGSHIAEGPLRAGYLGPTGKFIPSAGELSADLPERAIGAWNGAANTVGRRLDDSGYGGLHTAISSTVDSLLNGIADRLDSHSDSGTPVGSLNVSLSLMLGVGAFAVVLILGVVAVGWALTRGRQTKRAFQLDGNYR